MQEIQKTNYNKKRKRLIAKLMTVGLKGPVGLNFSIKKSHVFVKQELKETFEIIANNELLGEVFCSDFFEGDPYLIESNNKPVTMGKWDSFIILRKMLNNLMRDL